MRSVAIGEMHSFNLTDEGHVYMWGAFESPASEIPAAFEELRELKIRRVAAGVGHSAALTDEGKLYTWWDDKDALEFPRDGAAGAGYPLLDLNDIEGALCRPRCVEALAGMRIVSVTAGYQFTVVATDQGVPRHPSQGCACNLGFAATLILLRHPCTCSN
jgi:alpha-tubulin suppressor-like RCC1 family protein